MTWEISISERYASRTFPFEVDDVRQWLRSLPPLHTMGARITVQDASSMGTGGRALDTSGQYIKSMASRIRSANPSGTIRLFTVRVRHLKNGPVYTSADGVDYVSWIPAHMKALWERYRYVLRHEIGHYMQHRSHRLDGYSQSIEGEADAYAYSPRIANEWDIPAAQVSAAPS